MLLDNHIELLRQLVRFGYCSRQIIEYLLSNVGNHRGFSERTVRRYLELNRIRNRPNQEGLIEEVRNTIAQVRPYYGRRMLTGSLRAQNIQVSEVRVRLAMMAADPLNYAARQTDIVRRFNPVPYNSQYFGHKLHIDLNEKLIHYGCIVVGAIDGYSGLICSLFCIHRKNCVDVCQMYEELLVKFGKSRQSKNPDFTRKFIIFFNYFTKVFGIKYGLTKAMNST
jgi:hypothetical protein